jgi:streptomycin 6-kinase
MEGADEIDGLIFWNGDPTVILLESNRELNALLLERCLPGIPLRALPEEEQDWVVADLLKRAWRKPSGTASFRPLTEMISAWNSECEAQLKAWPDPELAKEGVRLRKELADGAADHVALLTDLHAGNVLQAKRMPWLAIDPKPFFGDPAYDATQHLLNCRQRLEDDPNTTIGRFADLLDIDFQRVRLWLFARLASECGGAYQGLARRVLKG